MKKVTVSITDDVYRCARIKAAERDVSVSVLVREFLMSLADEVERRRRLQDEVLKTIRRFRGSDRVRRNLAHDRALR